MGGSAGAAEGRVSPLRATPAVSRYFVIVIVAVVVIVVVTLAAETPLKTGRTWPRGLRNRSNCRVSVPVAQMVAHAVGKGRG